MANNDILDDLGDAKKYLEEVMGIVEDEEFNRERRRKLRLGQQQEKKQTVIVHDEDDESEDAWCCTKVLFYVTLGTFLTCIIIIGTNYKDEDSLGLRMMIQNDSLGLSALGPLFNPKSFHKGVKFEELTKLPMMILNCFSSIATESKPVLHKLWFVFEQKWLTPTVRVYKENFPFLENTKTDAKNEDIIKKETKNDKPQKEYLKEENIKLYKKNAEYIGKEEVIKEKQNKKLVEEEFKEKTKIAKEKIEDQKIKDFKNLQEQRRQASLSEFEKERNTDMEKEKTVKKLKNRKEMANNNNPLNEDFGAFVSKDL